MPMIYSNYAFKTAQTYFKAKPNNDGISSNTTTSSRSNGGGGGGGGATSQSYVEKEGKKGLISHRPRIFLPIRMKRNECETISHTVQPGRYLGASVCSCVEN